MISWGMLYPFEKRNLLALGFTPVYKRVEQFGMGLGTMAIILLASIGIETLLLDITWAEMKFDVLDALRAFWYHLKSALTEDLIFRGAILYICLLYTSDAADD